MLAFLLLQNKLGRVGLVTANCRGDGRLLQRRRQNLKQKVTTNDSALRRKNVIINEMMSMSIDNSFVKVPSVSYS